MSEEDKVPSPDGVGVVPEPEPETVRRRPKWLAPVAAGCVLVLLAVGGVAGCRLGIRPGPAGSRGVHPAKRRRWRLPNVTS